MKRSSIITRNLTVVIIGLMLHSCLLFDKDGPKRDEIFIKYYGGEEGDQLVDIEYLTADNTYLIAGNSNSFSANGLGDIILIKTDEEGIPVGELVINTNEEDSVSYEAESLKVFGNTIAVTGYRERLNSSGLFDTRTAFVFFSNGDFNATSTIQLDSVGVDLTGNDIVQTTDGNFVVLCTSGEITDTERDLVYMKIDAAGNVLWRRTNQIPGRDIGVSIIELNNGDLAICAQTDRISVRGFGGVNALFMVTNELGFLKNSLAYGQSSGTSTLIDDVPTKMIKDGPAATIIGNSDIGGSREGFILPLTAIGAVDSLRSVNLVAGQTDLEVNDITRALNGDYLVAGSFLNYTNEEGDNSIAKGQQIMFLRLDQLGISNLSSNHIGDGFEDTGNAILQLPDGQILIGATVSFGGSVTKLTLVKVNPSGELFK